LFLKFNGDEEQLPRLFISVFASDCIFHQ